MKTILSLAAVAGLVSGAFADIQDPPSNDYGPTRKLGRGVTNFVFAPTEFFVTVNEVNQLEGNSAGAGYGVWRGLGRSATRGISGLIEILTFPFPIWRESYYPFCRPTFLTFMPAMRNFRLNSATNRNILTCAIRTTISISIWFPSSLRLSFG